MQNAIEEETDSALLRRYLDEASQEPFTQIVQRHLNMVYAAALRQVKRSDLAEDVTQAVFLVLTRKAANLKPMPTLAGWLMTVTRYCAIDAMRKQAVRQRHEQSAARQRPETSEASIAVADEWSRLSPILDEALNKLSAVDRDAVVLRYFEDEPFAEIGRKLNLSEEAARKRVTRALERLRGSLSRKGVVVPAASLATAIGAQASIVAPASLIAISAAAAPSAAAVSISTGAVTMMAWTKAKLIALVLSLFVVAGTGSAIILAQAPKQPAGVAGSPATQPAPTTAPIAPPTLALNELIERTINDDGERTNSFIDLDTGMLITPNAGPVPGQSSEDWAASQGIDAAAETAVTGPGLFSFHLVNFPVANEVMDRPAVAIDNEIRRATPASLSVMSALGELPRTYIFKTRDGNIGALQIIELQHDQRPRYIKIRYKLIEQLSSEATPEGLARKFVALISAGDTQAVSSLLITRDEMATLFNGDIDSIYPRLEAPFKQSLNNLAESLKDAQFLSHARGPTFGVRTMEAGHRFGPLTVKGPTQAVDNVQIRIRTNLGETTLKLDEMVEVNGHWRLLAPPELR